ncbi:glycoside hydrolase family 78 protein [Umezawaea endophytica]|uniref:alpha-L-rhamnosidase n=1 Tax=Umezawaea endophytica TaxID=1654476 RepID=A0A9X2VKZ4_9PSEU|nr:glycoside hydrolase family 78 protein [Umezawaea endophytica]MCS7478467.1 glycoside hydrolase family 78 protein [Umezawaea endophytica]
MRRAPTARRGRLHVLVASLVLLLISTTLAGPTASAATPVSLADAHWVWFPEGNPAVSAPAGDRYFRRTFTVPTGGVTEAQFVVTGDDTVDVWLNGTPLASSVREVDSWTKSLHVDLRSALTSGANTLAVVARNSSAGPAGLLGRVRVVTAGGTVDFGTDNAWRVSQTPADGWEKPGFGDGGWSAAADLGANGTGPWGTRVVAPDPNAASPLGVGATTTERRVDPLGVDTPRPRFGWKLTGGGGQAQGAYQVLVSTSADAATGNVWDSGPVASGQSVDVVHAGGALASHTRYYWRVKVWDTQGRASGWSAVRSFETGLLTPATEWQGAFIGQPGTSPGLGGANWIWYPEGDPSAGVPAATRYFRANVTLASAPQVASLIATGDDTVDVWINGTQVSTSPRVADSWKTAAVVDVASRLRAGANTIALSGQNTSQSPAGVIARLVVGSDVVASTDGSWKSSQTAPAGWEQPGFNDSSWAAARVAAAYGAGAWGSGVSVPQTTPSPLLRKAFTVGKPVAKARLFTTALGLQETRLNGAKVGDDVLAPGWTDYRKRLQYKEYDVTSRIVQGSNALGAWLGNGWYAGTIAWYGGSNYGPKPWYSAQLRLTYTDGTTSVVATDSSWKYAAGPITADDMQMGERYDARKLPAGWDGAAFNDSSWGAVGVRSDAPPKLVSQADEGVRVQQDRTPIAITQPKPGVWIFDLGQNATGWNRLRVAGPAGTVVTMRHGEILNADGTLYTDNLRIDGLGTDKYTLSGNGTETYEPRFTVHGYRYVEVTGFPGTPTTSAITGRTAWTAAPEAGTLTTSNPMLNKVQQAIVWGQRSNMLSLPTDCPQRNERLGWTGDIASFAATSTFNMDMSTFLDKFADDLTDAQHADGAFTNTAPDLGAGQGIAGWGDAGVIVPYTLWQRSGNLRVVDENFSAMTRWIEFLRSTADGNLIRDDNGFGDWLNVQDDTARNIISTAYFSWSARLVSRMAEATGRTADASKYAALADQVAAAFTSRFVAADGTVSGNTQTGYVLALAFGLVPQNRKQSLVDKLVARIGASGGHLTVGFLGVENLLPVLVDHGRSDVAYQVLLQPGYPGWGYMVNTGGTTIWERWDSIRPDGSLQDKGMNSFNHYGFGSVGDFLYRQVGGLGPASPGYRSLLIAPKPGGGLTSAKSAYETPYGQAVSDWSISGGVLTLRVTVPAGASATVRVPAGSAAAVTAPAQAVPFGYGGGAAAYRLPAGSYTFTAPA